MSAKARSCDNPSDEVHHVGYEPQVVAEIPQRNETDARYCFWGHVLVARTEQLQHAAILAVHVFEEGDEAVAILLRERVILVIVALRAPGGESEPTLPRPFPLRSTVFPNRNRWSENLSSDLRGRTPGGHLLCSGAHTPDGRLGL